MDQSYKSGPPTSRPQLLNLNQCPAWPRAAMGTGGVRKEGQGRGRGMAGMKSPPPGSSGAVREKKERRFQALPHQRRVSLSRGRGGNPSPGSTLSLTAGVRSRRASAVRREEASARPGSPGGRPGPCARVSSSYAAARRAVGAPAAPGQRPGVYL